MFQKGVNAFTNSALTSLCKSCKTLNNLKQIHAHLLKTHLPENPSAIAPLVSVVATSNIPAFFSYACSIFYNLVHKSTFMYNTMIRGYVQSNSPTSAILCYVGMLNSQFTVNNYTFPPLIKACSILLPQSKLTGCLVHAQVFKFGFEHDPFVVSSLIEFYSMNHDMESARMLFDNIPERDVVVWTTMIDGYGKIGDVKDASALFEEMPERNVISWSAIIAAYSRTSDFKEVFSLYNRMQGEGVKPNESILVSVLTACAHMGALGQGFWVHSYAKRCGLERNPILGTALVDMYSKCGRSELALSVFEAIPNKDVGAWNAMISGVAMNGDANRALELFHNMVLTGTQPTETTFVAVLSACTHARFVRQGLELFQQISSLYGIEPKYEHYACVVDLLARAGRLEEAEKFIEEKIGGIKGGDANVWGALLAACRLHSNVEVGNRIWRKLADRRLSDIGNHVLSYNIYKEAGWEVDANSVRQLITEAGMKKKPGCSLIEVNGKVEEFLAGDLLHPKAQEICKMLYSLSNVFCFVQ